MSRKSKSKFKYLRLVTRKDGLENMTLTDHIESTRDRGEHIITYFMSRYRKLWSRTDNKGINISYIYKGLEAVKSHDQIRFEETKHIEEVKESLK